MLTVPMFVFMGYMLSESGIAEDMYKAIHVWMGSLNGGLALGTVGLMVIISAMNGLSVAGLAIGATIALPELLRRGYDKVMMTGVVQGGSTLGILLPPSVVLILYGMIARVPVGQLWLAGVLPGLLMAVLMGLYVWLRVCRNCPAGYFRADDVAVFKRSRELGGKLRRRRDFIGSDCLVSRALKFQTVERSTAQNLGHYLHVYVDIDCRPVFWRGLRRPWRG